MNGYLPSLPSAASEQSGVSLGIFGGSRGAGGLLPPLLGAVRLRCRGRYPVANPNRKLSHTHRQPVSLLPSVPLPVSHHGVRPIEGWLEAPGAKAL